MLYGGAAGGGKSFLGCLMCMVYALAYPNTAYAIARKDKNLIPSTTLKSFFEVSSVYKLDKYWKYRHDDLDIIFANGSIIQFVECKKMPSDPVYRRLGGLLLTRAFIDEATEIELDGVETLMARTDRWRNKTIPLLAKTFMTCNPEKGWANDLYYKPFMEKTLPPRAKFIAASLADNPYLSKNYGKMMSHFHSKSVRERLLEGKWEVTDAVNQLIPTQMLEKCFTNEAIGDAGPFYGVDVARFGGDKSVIAKMMGNTLYYIKRYSKSDTVKFAHIVQAELLTDTGKPENVGIDSAGVGSGTTDVLRQLGMNVYEIFSGTGMRACRATGTMKFSTHRSQMWWLLKMDIEEGNIHFSDDLTDDQLKLIIDDLTAPTYDFVKQGVVMVEPKEKIRQRLKRSPDYGDAIVYANWMRHLRSDRQQMIEQKDIPSYTSSKSYWENFFF